MYLLDDFLGGADEIRAVLFVPFDPFPPHVNHLLFLEFTGDGESGDGFEVGVEGLGDLGGGEFFGENLSDGFLVRLDLGEFGVCEGELGCLFH